MGNHPSKKKNKKKNASKQKEYKPTEQDIQRTKILEEFLETEQIFVTQLQILRDRFIKPLQSFLTNEEFTLIFSEIQLIIGINENFLMKLSSIIKVQKPEERDKSFADLLIEFSHSFKLYVTYISQYNQCLARIQAMQRKNKKFNEKVKQIQKDLKDENKQLYDLFSYLILPIQR